MTTPNDTTQLSLNKKRERIKELESELGTLKNSLTEIDDSTALFPFKDYKVLDSPPQNQVTVLDDVDHSSINLSLLHSIPDIVYFLNFDAEIIFGNVAFENWFQMPMDMLVGKKILSFIPQFEQTKFYQNFIKVLNDRQPRVIVEEFDQSKGNSNTQHWYEARVFPVPEGILIIVRDITRQREEEAKKLELQLTHARMQMLDEIVNTLEHDLRTPLSILNTSIYLLEHYTDPEKQQKKLQVVKQQVGILETMIENILLLTKLDEYRPSDLSRFDVAEIVETATGKLQSKADAKNQTLRLTIPHEPIYHQVHTDHLSRAIGHIIDNAISYTPDDGTIDVILEPKPPHGFQITIRDTGIGIDAENLPLVFNRFYRVNEARTSNEAGNGLGLSIAKSIVELHDGTIHITSKPNDGTEVTVMI